MKTIEIKSAWQGNTDCNAYSIRNSVVFAMLNEELLGPTSVKGDFK